MLRDDDGGRWRVGFVATTPSGVPTTLKRSGSDFTATIVANLCSAGKITMWKNVRALPTDARRRCSRRMASDALAMCMRVDGIYTADPYAPTLLAHPRIEKLAVIRVLLLMLLLAMPQL
eukprot:2747072-Rhodomonas_salina.2